MKIRPHREILPPAQCLLWNDLRLITKMGFTLYGGTAIALRLGHRQSVDFDFFSVQRIDHNAIYHLFPRLQHAETLQSTQDTLTVLVPIEEVQQSVKLSFFGELCFGRVGKPEYTDDGTLLLASLQDLMASKLKVILQRIEAKDYRDIAAMIHAGCSLAQGLVSARLLYGSSFSALEALKALVYFEEGDLHTLTTAEKDTLVQAARNIRELTNLPFSASTLSLNDHSESLEP